MTEASKTALGNLALACIAASERDPLFRVEDSIAPQLLRWSDGAAATARIGTLRPILRRAVERLIPGIYGYALARTLHMDRIVRQEIAAGIDSLVILGAGYDTRPYRMRDELADVGVIEVDLPATSRDKRKRLAEGLGFEPAEVTFIEADVSSPGLMGELEAFGVTRSAKTLFLLSGVSMYLTAEAMANVFDEVAADASERTSLLFDYIDANALMAPEGYFGGEWITYARRAGEEPTWGIERGGATALVAGHGYALASDADAAQLTSSYLQRADGSTVARPFSFGAVAHIFPSG